MVYDKCPCVQFTPSDGRHFSIFEIDLIHEKGRFRFVEQGAKLKTYHRGPEPVYGDYEFLPDEEFEKLTLLSRGLMNVWDNVADVLDNTAEPICSLIDALEVHRVHEHLIGGR